MYAAELGAGSQSSPLPETSFFFSLYPNGPNLLRARGWTELFAHLRLRGRMVGLLVPGGPWLTNTPAHLGCLRASGCDSPPGLGFPSHKKKLSIQAPDRLNFDLWLSLLSIASHKGGPSQGQGCAPSFYHKCCPPNGPMLNIQHTRIDLGAPSRS